MRAIVRLRKMEKHHRDEADALLDTYRNALGMALTNPLAFALSSSKRPASLRSRVRRQRGFDRLEPERDQR